MSVFLILISPEWLRWPIAIRLVLFATDSSTCFVCNRPFDLFCMQQILRLVLYATDPSTCFVCNRFNRRCLFGVFDSYGDVTITGEELPFWPILDTHGQWGSLAYYTYCDTKHQFTMVISEDPWHLHLWQWNCHYLWLRLWSVAAGIWFKCQTFRIQGERANRPGRFNLRNTWKQKRKRCTAPSLQLTWIDSLCELLWSPVVCYRSIFLYISLSVCKLFTFFSPEPLGYFQPNVELSILVWRHSSFLQIINGHIFFLYGY